MFDQNDLLFVSKRFGVPEYAVPAPISIFKDGFFKGQEKINPHLTVFKYADGRNVSVFHIKPIYYLHQNGQWRPMHEIASGFGNKWINLREDWDKKCDLRYLRWLMGRMEYIKGSVNFPINPSKFIPLKEGQNILFTTDTFNPQAGSGGANVSVDGQINVFNALTWALAHDALSGTADNTGASGNPEWSQKSSDTAWNLIRGFYHFDTSALPDTDTISAATFSSAWQGTGGGQDADSISIHVVASTTASDNVLVDGDYDQLGATSYGSLALASYTQTDGTYNDKNLNATGIAAISKTGVTKLATRTSRDLDNSAPTGFNVTYGYYADQTGTDKDPRLVVTHASSTSIKTINGLAKASAKTRNGLAIASVKTYNGLS